MDISFDVTALESQSSVNGASGAPGITPLANTHCRRNQAGGVDSMALNVWCEMADGPFQIWMEKLAEAQQVARARRYPAVVTVGVGIQNARGYLASVQPRGSRAGAGYKYVFEVEGVQFLIAAKSASQKRPNVMVEAMGGAMMRFNWCPLQLWRFAETVLRHIGYRVDRHSIARIDAFVDVPGIQAVKFRKAAEAGRLVRRAAHVAKFSVVEESQLLRAVERNYERGKAAVVAAVESAYEAGVAILKRAVCEARMQGEMDLATYGVGAEGSGLQVGKGSVVCRIYDKVFQLKRFYAERLEAMREVWGVGDDVPVTRVEFQLRGAWLRQRGIKTLDDWIVKQRAVVEYLSGDWLCLADYDGHNKDRRVIDPRWKRVQAFFRQAFGPRRKRARRVVPQIDPRSTERMIKTAVSLLRTASGRAFGPLNDVGEYRIGVHQLVEEGVTLYDGWDAEYSGHLHRLHEYYQRGGFEVEPNYPFQVWSRRSELVDVAGMPGVRSMAGVPNG